MAPKPGKCPTSGWLSPPPPPPSVHSSLPIPFGVSSVDDDADRFFLFSLSHSPTFLSDLANFIYPIWPFPFFSFLRLINAIIWPLALGHLSPFSSPPWQFSPFSFIFSLKMKRNLVKFVRIYPFSRTFSPFSEIAHRQGTAPGPTPLLSGT